jgi:anti-sigma factor RsiW
MADVDLHVNECPDCSLRRNERDQVDALLREAVLAEPVDASRVTEVVRKEMQGHQPTLTAPRRRVLVAGCGLAIILAVIAIALTRKLHGATLYTYAAEDHIAEVVDRAPRPWTNGGPQIEQMLQQHLALSGLVQALAPDGYHIEHAMICPLSTQRYAHLIYSNGNREISFFIGQKDDKELPGEAIEHANGYSVHAGRVDGLQIAGFQTRQFNILLVGNLPLEEAIRFIERATSAI